MTFANDGHAPVTDCPAQAPDRQPVMHGKDVKDYRGATSRRAAERPARCCAERAGAPSWVFATGPALDRRLDGNAWVVRPEASDTAGEPSPTVAGDRCRPLRTADAASRGAAAS